MNRRLQMACGAALAAALCVAELAAQKRDQRSSPVGVRARIEQLVLPNMRH